MPWQSALHGGSWKHRTSTVCRRRRGMGQPCLPCVAREKIGDVGYLDSIDVHTVVLPVNPEDPLDRSFLSAINKDGEPEEVLRIRPSRLLLLCRKSKIAPLLLCAFRMKATTDQGAPATPGPCQLSHSMRQRGASLQAVDKGAGHGRNIL